MYEKNFEKGTFMNAYFALLAVVEHKSFTKAAEKLGYTQSAVSQLVKGLEKELDTKLIIRSRSGLELTPDGTAYFPYVQNICSAVRELHEKKNVMQGLERSIIRIGAFSSIAYSYIPQWMKTFKALYPHIQFELRIGDYTEIEQMIVQQRVDFGFVNPQAVTQLQTKTVLHDDLLACVAPEHALAAKPRVTIEQLAREPFILMEEGTISETMRLFHERKLTPNIQYTVEGDYPVMAMVAQNLGVSILPSLFFGHVDERIVKIPLQPARQRKISIAYKDKSILPIASRMFIDFVESECRNV